jgi:glycerophosphoryl diester phosphodiesterase
MVKKFGFALLVLSLAACTTGKKTATTALNKTFDEQAHRGGRGLMPENTIPAMLHAIDLGVTTLELDAVISADNQVVVSHDVFFNEHITTTPEGTYLTKAEAAKRLIYKMPYDSVRKYDVGLKPYPDFPRQKKIAAVKPLLADLLDATQAYAKEKGRTIAYNIEIKSRPDYDGLKHPPVEQFTDLVAGVIRSKGLESVVTIQSFDPRALQIIHRKYPGFATSLLIEANEKRSLDEQLQQLGFIPTVYSPHYSLVTPALLEKCHSRKIAVITWTVNTLELMKKLKDMGVDGLITDYPDLYAQL